ncbi:MAG: DUF2459 domain-containing protein [Cyanobacteria bacterium P01_G01_bin.19]
MRLFRLLKVFALSIVTLVIVVAIAIGSPTTIVAPINPADPTTVYIADFGYHGKLILPTHKDELLQYAYGDWNYFALNRQNWNNALAALLIPTQGTLGRRKFKDLTELQQSLGLDWQNILFSLEVPRNRVLSLEKSLDTRFNQKLNTSVFNPHFGLTFVKDERDYTLWHNSNHELISWFENLGCQVRGFRTLPNFQPQNNQ